MIPFVLCQAHGGKLITIDDRAVVKDLAAADGSGGTIFEPTLRTGPIRPGAVAFGKVRRLVQRIVHDGAVTVAVAIVRDNQESAALTRVLVAGDPPNVVVPLNETGHEFQLNITLSAFDAMCGLSDAELYVIPREGPA